MTFQFNPGCNCCGDPECSVFTDCCSSYTPAAQVEITIPSIFDTRSGIGEPGYCDDVTYPCTNVCDGCASIGGTYIADKVSGAYWVYEEVGLLCDLSWFVANCSSWPMEVYKFQVSARLQCNVSLGCWCVIAVEFFTEDPILNRGACYLSEGWDGYTLFNAGSNCSTKTFTVAGWPTQRVGPLICMKTGTGTATMVEI